MKETESIPINKVLISNANQTAALRLNQENSNKDFAFWVFYLMVSLCKSIIQYSNEN